MNELKVLLGLGKEYDIERVEETKERNCISKIIYVKKNTKKECR